jgi:quercetin dioxygenase-like cupin family protein
LIPESNIIQCDDLNQAVDHYTKTLGYRLEMITPADAPREALLSKDGAQKWIVSNAEDRARTADWIAGRAGMEYRDLIPGRLGGKVIASHIRLKKAGEVADYVHYHKVDFQVIYCKRGRIKVVYEDQGGPFWLESGDCVLQPPEIRHRVLECTAGAEVIEITMPAEHETWVEHEITLPTNEINTERDFNGQRFIRHIASEAVWTPSVLPGFEERDTGISKATGGRGDVRVLRAAPNDDVRQSAEAWMGSHMFCFVIKGEVPLSANGSVRHTLMPGDSRLIGPDDALLPTATGDAVMLIVSF